MSMVVRFDAFGGPEVLRVETSEVRDPLAGEVRIDVAAFGLNRVEALYRSGGFGPVRFPATIGYEAAGIVEAVGDGVTGLAAGDRVAVLYGLSMETYGTCADRIVYSAERVVKLPMGLSLIDAAASYMQYGTAFALVEIAGVAAGDHVVITAASSSVGIAAIQIANAHGAVSIAITRGRSKQAALEMVGAAHVIVADEEDPAERIHAITGGGGARIVFDAVAGPQLAAMLPAIAPEGIAIVYGMLGGTMLEAALAPVMLANLTIRGWSADLYTAREDRRRRLVDAINPALASGTLRPVIARTFALDRIVDAHRYLESNAQVGKIVVIARPDLT